MGFGAPRQELRHHIGGDGIEIGALHQPFNLSDLPVTRVRYVDRMPVEQLRLQYPELSNEHFVHIDLIDDGQVLATIPDESLDFIIANHMIEHCDNTLGALETWLSKLRRGGIIFMAVPDQRKGWDERREVTSLEHILQDYRSTAVERKGRNYEHFKSWTELVGNIHDEAHVRRLIDIDYSIHFHVFTFESFRFLLDYANREMRLPFRVVDAVEPSDSSWESVFVLQKTHLTTKSGGASPSLH
jgi:predicted SAM-dependent methyltransferase